MFLFVCHSYFHRRTFQEVTVHPLSALGKFKWPNMGRSNFFTKKGIPLFLYCIFNGKTVMNFGVNSHNVCCAASAKSSMTFNWSYAIIHHHFFKVTKTVITRTLAAFLGRNPGNVLSCSPVPVQSLSGRRNVDLSFLRLGTNLTLEHLGWLHCDRRRPLPLVWWRHRHFRCLNMEADIRSCDYCLFQCWTGLLRDL